MTSSAATSAGSAAISAADGISSWSTLRIHSPEQSEWSQGVAESIGSRCGKSHTWSASACRLATASSSARSSTPTTISPGDRPQQLDDRSHPATRLASQDAEREAHAGGESVTASATFDPRQAGSRRPHSRRFAAVWTAPGNATGPGNRDAAETRWPPWTPVQTKAVRLRTVPRDASRLPTIAPRWRPLCPRFGGAGGRGAARSSGRWTDGSTAAPSWFCRCRSCSRRSRSRGRSGCPSRCCRPRSTTPAPLQLATPARQGGSEPGPGNERRRRGRALGPDGARPPRATGLTQRTGMRRSRASARQAPQHLGRRERRLARRDRRDGTPRRHRRRARAPTTTRPEQLRCSSSRAPYARPASLDQPASPSAHTIVFLSTDAGAFGGIGAVRFLKTWPRRRARRRGRSIWTRWAERGRRGSQIAGDHPLSPPRALLQTAPRADPARKPVTGPLTRASSTSSSTSASRSRCTSRGRSSAHAIPALTITTGGDRPPDAFGDSPQAPQTEDVRRARARRAGSSLRSLDQGLDARKPTPSFVWVGHRLVRGWAIELVLIALLIPFLVGAVDLFAFCRRRRIPLRPAFRALAHPARLLALRRALLLRAARARGVAVGRPAAAQPGLAGRRQLARRAALVLARSVRRRVAACPPAARARGAGQRRGDDRRPGRRPARARGRRAPRRRRRIRSRCCSCSRRCTSGCGSRRCDGRPLPVRLVVFASAWPGRSSCSVRSRGATGSASTRPGTCSSSSGSATSLSTPVLIVLAGHRGRRSACRGRQRAVTRRIPDAATRAARADPGADPLDGARVPRRGRA